MIKKVVLSGFLALITLAGSSQVSLSYYLPKEISYNSEIPTPEEFTGHQVGEWHITHDKLYYYMLKLSEISDRAVWEEYGRSHEERPLGNLIISSSENISKLDHLRMEHVRLSDPAVSGDIDISDMPVFIKLGYGVHGNESSAQNASMLVAYYLIAGLGDEIDNLLDNTVILIDPSLNPDGLQRHSTWVNMYKSKNLNPDEASIEFSEAWPGGRTNHYWFDLNRDYVMLQHPESVGRVTSFHRWKPNINTDHHEMGASSTFFFQPGVRSRENPLTPDENYNLVTEIAEYHIKHLNNIGRLYYSEEVFDDFYLGKGSSYPDIHASAGILFEQAGVKGHLRETSAGTISFPFAIKNQFTVSLSTLEAGLKMRKKLLQHQKDFYREVIDLAANDQVKGYVFSEPGDKARAAHFIENLLYHQIKVYRLGKDITTGGNSYSAGTSYYVPLNQPEYRYIKSMFETVTKFEENVFYDISTWVLPYSFNIPYSSIGNIKGLTALKGPEVFVPPFAAGNLRASRDVYAYIFEWSEYYSPRALYRLLDGGLKVRVATSGFLYDDGEFKRNFRNGTIMIPAYGQVIDRDGLYELMKDIVAEAGITVYGVSTGHTPEGIDLGSNSFVTLKKPEIAMFIGGSIRSGDAGEIWHMLDQRFNIPVTMINPVSSRSLNLDKYSVLILTGSPSLSETKVEEIKRWNRSGGTIIAYKGGNSFISKNKMAPVKVKPSPEIENKGDISYADRSALFSVHRIPGTIFETRLDLTHPLCYGYVRNTLPVFKNHSTAYELSSDLFANPVVYTGNPLLSGYSSDQNIENVAGSAFVSVFPAGRGRIISIYDNTNFRAIWFGTSKIFMNGLFFGQIMSSGRRWYEE